MCSTVHVYKTWYVHTLYTTHYALPHLYQILIRKSELFKISQHRSLKYFNGVIYCKPAKVSLPMEATSTAMHTIAIKLPLLMHVQESTTKLYTTKMLYYYSTAGVTFTR